MKTYRVAHKNGSDGIYSDWYTDADSGGDFGDAKRVADKTRSENPEHDGWYRFVAVLDEDDQIVYDPDADYCKETRPHAIMPGSGNELVPVEIVGSRVEEDASVSIIFASGGVVGCEAEEDMVYKKEAYDG